MTKRAKPDQGAVGIAAEAVLRCRTADQLRRRQETPTVGHLRELIHEIGPGDFLVVERVDPPTWQRYIQTRLRQAGEWVVEYRAGRADRHYQATTDDLGVVESALVGWAGESPGWRRQLAWQRVPPEEFRAPPQIQAGREPETAAASPEKVVCPGCGDRPRRILYGLPSARMFDAAKRGEILLGGCMVTPTSPRWRCSRCGHEWADGVSPGLDGIAGIAMDDLREKPENRVKNALGDVEDDPTPERLHELVGRVGPDNPSLTVYHLGFPTIENFARVQLSPAGGYVVEYRAGRVGRQYRRYQATTDDIALVDAAITGWSFNGLGWWGQFDWRRLEPTTNPSTSTVGTGDRQEERP